MNQEHWDFKHGYLAYKISIDLAHYVCEGGERSDGFCDDQFWDGGVGGDGVKFCVVTTICNPPLETQIGDVFISNHTKTQKYRGQ